MSNAAVIASVLSALLCGGAGVAIINAVANRRRVNVEVSDRLSDSALKWVQEFQEEAQRARLEGSEARREVAEVRRELATVRREAEALATDLRNLRGAIMAPNATLERLRALVGGGDVNGRP